MGRGIEPGGCGRAFRPDAFRSGRAIWHKSVGPEGPPTTAPGSQEPSCNRSGA
ncbi:DUF6053 domain-containing protein [Lysobacter enzymogenes]|uniref:DUF6053 domain-containing protein n=1 Tax=Lysobacter enzymogenes TaxID=69 RepID=UPI003D18BF6C